MRLFFCQVGFVCGAIFEKCSFARFFPQLRETLWEIFGFLRIFPQKNAVCPKNPLITPFFPESGCGKFCSNFPQLVGFFTKTDFFHTKPNKIPHNCGKLCGKNQRVDDTARTQVGALLGASSRHSACFVSRCVSKSYVNITKVMRNRISTTEIRFRGNCGAARRVT